LEHTGFLDYSKSLISSARTVILITAVVARSRSSLF